MASRADEYLIMPDDELKKIYRRYVKWQRWLTALPIFGGIITFIGTAIGGFFYLTLFSSFASVSPFILSIVHALVIMIHGMRLLTDDVKAQKINFVAFSLIYAVMILLCVILTDGINILVVSMTLFTIAAQVIDYHLVNQICMLRSLPSFPFDGETKQLMCESMMTREQMAEYLKQLEKGKCIQPDYEDILDGEFERHKPKKPDKDEFFQQHETFRKW